MCSFCLRVEAEVSFLVAGPGVRICNDCVARCVEILDGATPSGPVVDWAGLDDEAMLARLPRISTVADQVESSLQAWVSELRTRGVTWERVGAALGMRRQSAWMRFGHDSREVNA